MKILHIITRLNVGGTSTYLKNLTDYLNTLGCKNLILYGMCESNEIDFTKNETFLADLIQIKSLRRSINLYLDVRSFFLIRQAIKEIRPDIVNTHTSKAGIIGRIATKSVDKKIVVVHTYHGHLVQGYFNRIKSSIFVIIERLMIHFTDRVIAVSENTMKTYLDLKVGTTEKWKLIRTGIPIKNFQSRNIDKSQEFKLLWVGRFTKIKNPFLAIRVIQSLSMHSSNRITLTMVGGGELWEICKKESIGFPINFTGWIKTEDIGYSNFDLLILTSKNEAAGLVILEAANHYVPTISNEVGGVSEYIKHNNTGYLVPGEIKEFIEAINYLINNLNVLKQMGVKARYLVESDFSVEKMANEYFNLYQSLLI